MYSNLLTIYKDKIVIEPIEYDTNKYYYFYGEDSKIFGIEKTITLNEYKLIKSFFLEKQINYDNTKSENIFKYLFENGKYPFKNKMRFVVVSGVLNEEIKSLIEEIYPSLETLKIENSTILFYEEEWNQNISDIFQTISYDFEKQLFIHEGLIIDKNIKGELISHYLGCLNKTNWSVKDYTNIVDLVLNSETSIINSLLIELKTNYIDRILNKNNNSNIIEVFFKNDLNVSQTAKDLYLNRNSLINKLDTISKELGFNVQSFRFASILLGIMSLK